MVLPWKFLNLFRNLIAVLNSFMVLLEVSRNPILRCLPNSVDSEVIERIAFSFACSIVQMMLGNRLSLQLNQKLEESSNLLCGNILHILSPFLCFLKICSVSF